MLYVHRPNAGTLGFLCHATLVVPGRQSKQLLVSSVQPVEGAATCNLHTRQTQNTGVRGKVQRRTLVRPHHNGKYKANDGAPSCGGFLHQHMHLRGDFHVVHCRRAQVFYTLLINRQRPSRYSSALSGCSSSSHDASNNNNKKLAQHSLRAGSDHPLRITMSLHSYFLLYRQVRLGSQLHASAKQNILNDVLYIQYKKSNIRDQCTKDPLG